MAIQHIHLKTYRWALIADAHRRALKRRFYPQLQAQENSMDTIDINMTPVMISILASGMEQAEFTLTPQQRGSRPQRLVDAKLIEPAGKWKYAITDLGRAAYQKIMAESEIGTDDATRGVTTGISADGTRRVSTVDWYESVIDPLMTLMAQHKEGITRMEVEHDPDLIVRWASTMRQSLSHMDDIADERAKTIEQKDSQIEALRRCIGEMEVKMVQLEKQANSGHAMLAAQILDELCDLIPEVESYRMARESAVKAISNLKARR